MSADDELAERGRAIFERLRGSGDEAGEAPDESHVEAAAQPTDSAPLGPAGGAGTEPDERDRKPDRADDAPSAEPAPDVEPPLAGADAQGDEGGPVGHADEGDALPPDDDRSAEAASTGEAREPDDARTAAPAPSVEADLPETDAFSAGPAHTDDAHSAATGGGPLEPDDGRSAAPDSGGDVEPGAADPPQDSAPDGLAPDHGERPSLVAAEATASVQEPPAPSVELPGADEVAVTLDSSSADAPTANPFARPLPRVLAIANQKGGVGKTTTAVNLGAALAELGYRVLVIDLDPQGNATTGLGVNPRNLETSVYDVIMHDVPLEDCIEPTSLRNLFVVPATIDLAGAEIELVPAFSRELKLRKALETVLEDFDFALIDCPPSLGLITVNGLAAATEVVVPIQCEYYALEGLGQLLRNVNLVQGNLNPRLEVSAIILTMYDARTKLADQVAGEVRAHFGTKVCRNIVPRTVRLSEAPSFGQPIIVFDPSSRGAIAYRELAKEVSGGAPQRVG